MGKFRIKKPKALSRAFAAVRDPVVAVARSIPGADKAEKAAQPILSSPVATYAASVVATPVAGAALSAAGAALSAKGAKSVSDAGAIVGSGVNDVMSIPTKGVDLASNPQINPTNNAYIYALTKNNGKIGDLDTAIARDTGAGIVAQGLAALGLIAAGPAVGGAIAGIEAGGITAGTLGAGASAAGGLVAAADPLKDLIGELKPDNDATSGASPPPSNNSGILFLAALAAASFLFLKK